MGADGNEKYAGTGDGRALSRNHGTRGASTAEPICAELEWGEGGRGGK